MASSVNNKKILKNTTMSVIILEQVGLTIPASSQIIIEPSDYLLLANEAIIGTEIETLIQSGDIVVNDGVTDLSADRGFDYIKAPDTALNIRFLGEPQRSNAFVSKNVQEAIEEARENYSGIVGRTFSAVFYNNGNTSNKWIYHVPTSEATDTLPYVGVWDMDIYGISFANKNTNINCDVEFYVNGITNPNLVYTLMVRNSRFYYKTQINPIFTMLVGDGLSIYVKKVGSSTPSSVEVDIFVRINSNNTAETGAN